MPVTLRQVFESPYLRGLYGIKPIRQTRPNACGACCVATALRYFGQQVTEQNCVDALGANDVIGTAPLAMVKYGSSKGLYTYGYTMFPLDRLLGRVDEEKVSLVRWPDRADCWNLLVGIEPHLEQVIIADPSSPHVFALIARETFERRWAASERLAVCFDRPMPSKSSVPMHQKHFRIRPFRKKLLIDGRTIALPPS